MKRIPIDEIHPHYHFIPLNNGKTASLYECIEAKIPDVDKNKLTIVYKYHVPCPLCGYKENRAHSYDGKFFATIQVVCGSCGIYFRPVILKNN